MANEKEADFVAIKIGDLNGTAIPDDAIPLEDRTDNGTLFLHTEDQLLQPGESYTVSFTSKDLSRMKGCQFTLSWDQSALDLVDIEHGLVQEQHLGLKYLETGSLTSSWDVTASVNDPNAILFSLIMKAKRIGTLQESFDISADYTKPEAYDFDLNVYDLDLNFGDLTTANAFHLYQNRPNPFNEQTIIGIDLPEAMDATLTIYDVTGKVVRFIDGTYTKGYNEIQLQRDNLPKGLLYYTLETDQFTDTKRMMSVE